MSGFEIQYFIGINGVETNRGKKISRTFHPHSEIFHNIKPIF